MSNCCVKLATTIWQEPSRSESERIGSDLPWMTPPDRRKMVQCSGAVIIYWQVSSSVLLISSTKSSLLSHSHGRTIPNEITVVIHAIAFTHSIQRPDVLVLVVPWSPSPLFQTPFHSRPSLQATKFFKLDVSSIQSSSNSLHTCHRGIKRISCIPSTNFLFELYILVVMYMEMESWTKPLSVAGHCSGHAWHPAEGWSHLYLCLWLLQMVQVDTKWIDYFSHSRV